MEKEIFISLRDVSIFQKKELILEDISLDLKEGEIYLLSGEIGSGKSTFLNFLSGQIPQKKGEAKILEFELKKITPKKLRALRRKIGLISQEDLLLFEDKTLLQNLSFFASRTHKTDALELRKNIQSVLQLLRLNALEKKYISELSRGQKQKAAIASAILHQPKIILADEPTSYMDPNSSALALSLLIKRAQKIKACLIISTHNLDPVKNLDIKAHVLQIKNKKIIPL